MAREANIITFHIKKFVFPFYRFFITKIVCPSSFFPVFLFSHLEISPRVDEKWLDWSDKWSIALASMATNVSPLLGNIAERET